MTGPEHYREAERMAHAARADHFADEEGFTGWSKADLFAEAQVHATLALAYAQGVRVRVRSARGFG